MFTPGPLCLSAPLPGVQALLRHMAFQSILCEWVFHVHAYVDTTCVPGASGGQKRALDFLKLK